MDILCLVVGCSVIAVFVFDRRLLLGQGAIPVFLICCLFFVAGLLLTISNFDVKTMPGVLMAPLIQLGLFRLMRRIFFKYLGREPRDTFLDWSPGMGADRVFNVLFFVLAGAIAMLLSIL